MRVATGKKRPVSLATDIYRLQLILPLLGSLEASSISTDDLNRYQDHRLEKGSAPETVNSDLRVIRKILNWAKREDLIVKLPHFEMVPVIHEDEFVPNAIEVSRIIARLPDRLVPLVTFLAETGCRTGEAFNLLWDNVDLKQAQIQIRASGSWTPKTRGSRRTIPISADLKRILASVPRKSPYVFTGKTPEVPIKSIKRAFATAVKKANIVYRGEPAQITPQSLRKSSATTRAMLGVPEAVLQGLLGHTPGSTVTHRYYVKAQEEHKRLATFSLDQLVAKQNQMSTNLATDLATANSRQRELNLHSR